MYRIYFRTALVVLMPVMVLECVTHGVIGGAGLAVARMRRDWITWIDYWRNP